MTTDVFSPRRMFNSEEFEARITEIKERIKLKREEAQEVFRQILSQLKVKDVVIPNEIKAQIDYFKQMLRIKEAEVDITADNLEQLCSQLAIDEILKAIQTLSTPTGKKSFILAKEFKDRLKTLVCGRLANEAMEAAWQQNVKSSDLLSVLNGADYKSVTKVFGGAGGFLKESLNLADKYANIIDKVPDQVGAQENESQRANQIDELSGR